MRRRHLQQREPGGAMGGGTTHDGIRGSSDGGRDGPGAWLPPASGEILLVTGNSYLRDEMERIVAAAGGSLRTAADAAQAAAGWDSAAVVLIGSDVRELPPRRRAPAVLLGVSGDDANIWQLAAVLGAERVALLPDAAAWLAEHLSAARSPEAGGHVLGLTGGSGGAGASTAAAWLAQAAAGHGARTLLIDGDPWGGGLELTLAAEDTPGLRWPDLAEARGSIDAVQLSDSLPVAGGFSFLSWPGTRERPPAVDSASVAAVMDAARRGFEVVIVDIGRGTDSLRTFAWDCDRILLLATAQLKSAVAAARLLNELPPVDTGLVIRGNTGAGMDAALIAESLGMPLHGVLPDIRGTGTAAELGRLLELGRRKPVRRFAAGVLELLDGDAP
ncbi:septum site-determining protein Ssd [Arthrobacter sp. CJ23]|uniref:septum site-determining protein Ssd n=1 Tax=Arthrobacter sp. CJ23 TaxID=2972479 RepID=UPI00215C089F|nr:septum site-determining protein Ssd [Arthrobacter sp. CJ23]UVJ38844.1 CpaE-like family protein [Arthrobacter sp. CJ23]